MTIAGATARIEDSLLYFLNGVTLTPTRRVAWPDMSFEREVGEIYLAPYVLWARSARGEIGPGAARRHTGLYQITTNGPIDGSSVPQKEVADALIEVFDRAVIDRNSLLVRFGSFDGSPGVPSRGPTITANGWRSISVTAPFWCDVFP